MNWECWEVNIENMAEVKLGLKSKSRILITIIVRFITTYASTILYIDECFVGVVSWPLSELTMKR